MCGIIEECLGVAQLVARDFWEVEAAGSSPVTQTKTLAVMYCQGVAQLVARSVRDAEVAGSSPVTLTRFEKPRGYFCLVD